MNFINENGMKINFHCCMKGECAVKSIDSAFDKIHKGKGQDDDAGLGLLFEPNENLAALFG